MEDLVNTHQTIFTPVKERVRKLPRQTLPIALRHWKNLWVPLNHRKTSREGTQKLMPQPCFLGFVSLESFRQLGLDFMSNRDPITHDF
jgi:hypothetical protein